MSAADLVRGVRTLWLLTILTVVILLSLFFVVPVPIFWILGISMLGVLLWITFLHNSYVRFLGEKMQAQQTALIQSRDALLASRATLMASNNTLLAAREHWGDLPAAGRVLVSQFERERVLETLCMETAHLLGVERVAVTQGQGENTEQTEAAFGFPDALPTPTQLQAISGVLAVPLSGVGNLYAVPQEQRPFGPDDHALLEEIAALAVVALSNARRYAESLRHGATLRRTAHEIVDADTAPEIAALTTGYARAFIDCTGAGLLLRGNGGQTLQLASHFSEDPLTPSAPLTVHSSLMLESLMAADGPTAYEDVLSLGEMAHWAAPLGARSLLAAPLRGHGSEAQGLLFLYWNQAGRVSSDEETALMATFAGIAAVALENISLTATVAEMRESRSEDAVRMLGETRRREQESHTFTRHLGTAVSEGANPKRLAALVAAHAYQLIPCREVVLSLRDAQNDLHALAAADDSGALKGDELPPWRSADFPLLRHVLSGPNAAPLVIASVAQDTRLEAREQAALLRDGVSSLLLVPLTGPGGQTIALLSLFWTGAGGSPTREQAEIAQAIAAQASLALENTRNFGKLTEVAQARDFAEGALEATLPTLGEGVLYCSAAGQISEVNRAAQTMIGISVGVGERADTWAARIGLRYPSGQAVPPGASPLVQTLQTGMPSGTQEFLVGQSPAERRVLLTVTPLPNSENGGGGAVAVLRDMTELTESRHQQAAANRRVETLSEISRRLNAAQDPAQVSEIVTEGALALLPDASQTRALLYSFDGERLPLTLVAAAPAPKTRRPQTLAQAQSFTVPFDVQSPILWQVYVTRQAVVISDLAADPQFADATSQSLLQGASAPAMPPRSALVLPLLAREEVAGHLLLTSSEPHAFDDLTLTDALSSLAALAVTARANAELSRVAQQRTEELNALWNVGRAITAGLELAEFADILTEAACSLVGAAVCTLSLSENGELRLQGQSYQDALMLGWETKQDPCDTFCLQAVQTGEPASASSVPNPRLTQCRWRAFAGQSGHHTVLSLPVRHGLETLGVFTAYRAGEAAFSEPQERVLGTLVALATTAILAARSHTRDFDLADVLQTALLPILPAPMPTLDIAAHAGDGYSDFIALGDQRLAVIIGEISVQNAPLAAAMVKYALRAFAAQGMTPAEIVSRVNVFLASENGGGLTATLFYGVLDLNAETLTYTNAGHAPPLLSRTAGVTETLEPTGPLLGAFAEAEYQDKTVAFLPGDTLLAYTDSLTAPRNSRGMFYGEGGVRLSLEAARTGNAAEIAAALRRDALAHSEGRLSAEIALIVLKREGR